MGFAFGGKNIKLSKDSSRPLHDDGLTEADMHSSLKVSRLDFRSSFSFHSTSMLELSTVFYKQQEKYFIIIYTINYTYIKLNEN